MSPRSATRVTPRRIGWSVVRIHECGDHRVIERKRFLKRESAAEWARAWMKYRWLPCFKGADLT